MSSPPSIDVAVVIERRRAPNRWQDWTFTVAEVLVDEGHFGTAPRTLRDDGNTRSVLFPGLRVSLHGDEAEGYHLNLSSDHPVWFVMWRIDDVDPSHAWPELVTLSYNEAARWLDAQEHVDNVPLPAPFAAELQAFTDTHYRPEPRKRRRPASFQAPDQR
jgi:hypothetical protein